MATSVQLRDRQPVGLGARLHRFLAARQRLGNGLQRHALLGEHVQLLHLGGGPGLLVAFEAVLHACTPASGAAARTVMASSRPWKATRSPASAPISARPSGAGKALRAAAGSASSEERRGGKEGASRWRLTGSPDR